MESILTSIKKLLGLEDDYTAFDQDIVMHINSVFLVLRQLGVGPSTGFRISDATAAWSDFLSDTAEYEAVKSYIYMKVKLLFDPPTSTSVMEAMNRLIAEFEWRLNSEADYGE